MKRTLLVSKYPLNKLNEAFDLSDYDYDDKFDKTSLKRTNIEIIHRRIQSYINGIKEILSKKLLGCEYDIVYKGKYSDLLKSNNALIFEGEESDVYNYYSNINEFGLVVKDVDQKKLMYVIDDPKKEISNDKIIIENNGYIPRNIFDEVVKKLRDKTGDPNALLKVIHKIA